MIPGICEHSVFDFEQKSDSFLSVPFFYNGLPMKNADFPLCFLTLASLGAMRFRWEETNSLRDSFFSSVFAGSGKTMMPIELIHSHTVYAVCLDSHDKIKLQGMHDSGDNAVPLRTGDGLISCDARIVPVVTVADCVPVYLYNPVKKCFGVLHSGWKGTGIAVEAIALAEKLYGTVAGDFCVVIGPHIHGCCYTVDKDRATAFAKRYGKGCVDFSLDYGSHLSLVAANLRLLVDAGVKPENILHCTDCTCCDNRFGSFRRETSYLPAGIPMQDRLKAFTPMAAFINAK